jgi:hypothetical protein
MENWASAHQQKSPQIYYLQAFNAIWYVPAGGFTRLTMFLT